MSNFFYKYSDYSSFQKAFRDTDGEDVVIDLLSSDASLKEDEVVADKHVIRKDNRFNQESSFNKFFGPRRSLNRNFDMKDFSSWKNKNYRETEKQIGNSDNEATKFSFSDFMNERSRGKTYNDDDQNRESNQKAINELSSDDPTFKRFSLNDYMRRLEEKTRVNSETRDNEDLIDSIGDITQDVKPDSAQDENFEENISGINVKNFVDDETFSGDRFAVDTSELDEMKSRLEELKTKTDEINKLIDDEDDVLPNEKLEENQDQIDDEDDNLDQDQELGDNIDDESDQDNIEIDEANIIIDDNELQEISDENEKIVEVNEIETTDEDLSEDNISELNEETSQAIEGLDERLGDLNVDRSKDSSINIINVNDVSGGENLTSSEDQNLIDQTNSEDDNSVGQILETTGDINQVLTTEQQERSQEIIKLIDKNEKERQDIESQLRQAEHEKIVAKELYEQRLKELEKSIEEKDKENQERALQEKIRNDNKLSEVRAEFESREVEIRRLEKESALKLKIAALLKKELKNNLSISNLEMNNKLLEIASLINQEKQKEKANKPKKTTTTRKRKSKRKIDSDIIGGIDFD